MVAAVRMPGGETVGLVGGRQFLFVGGFAHPLEAIRSAFYD